MAVIYFTCIIAVFFLLVNSSICATLYGTYSTSSDDDTVISTYFAAIDSSTGTITTLFDIADFYAFKFSVTGGNTAFDQVNSIFYYFDNSDSQFVNAIDVKNNKLLKMYTPNALQLNGLVYDSKSETLIVGGFYGELDHPSYGLVTMPTASVKEKAGFFNYTEEFGEDPFADTALDSANSIHYSVFVKNDSIQHQHIAAVDLKNEKAKTSPALQCDDYLVFNLEYDPTNLRLFSIGIQGQQWAYLEIDPKSYSCDVVTKFDANTTVSQTAYDAAAQIVYFTSESAYLYSFNIQSKEVSTGVPLNVFMESFAVSSN